MLRRLKRGCTSSTPIGGLLLQSGRRCCQGRSIVRDEDAQPVLGLERIDVGRQVMGPRAGPEFFQCVGLDPGPGYIELQHHARSERVRALRHAIQAVDTLGRHMVLRGNLGRCAVEVQSTLTSTRSLSVVTKVCSGLSRVPRRCGAPDNHRPNVI
jgi:hypothetical protein